MDKIIIITFSSILLIAGVTSIFLKKVFVAQYMNLKSGQPKGSFFSAMFRQPYSNGASFDKVLKEMTMFPYLRPVKIDNASADLTKLTHNIRTIHYLTYIIVAAIIILGLIAGTLYPNGFQTTM